MRLRTLVLTLSAAAALAAGSASPSAAAQAPEPKKPFDVARMPGRWYEIARTPNSINKGCQASSTDWSPAGDRRFKVVAACRKGSPTGPLKTMDATVRLTDPANNKVRMSVLGGLISRDYWIIDHADDYGWLIMGTPGGDYVAVMAARAHMAAAPRAEAFARLKSLGYDAATLVFPVQP